MLIVKSRWRVCECVLYGPFDFSTYFDICHNKMSGDKFILHLCYRSNGSGLGSCFISSPFRTQGDGSSWKWLVVMAKGKSALLALHRQPDISAWKRHSSLLLTTPWPEMLSQGLTPGHGCESYHVCRKSRAGNIGRATSVITLTEINYLKEQPTSVPSSLIIWTRKGRAT